MLDWISDTVNSLGYVGIALLMLLENIFPPIPSELIMPLSGFAVTQGKLNFIFVVLAGIIGSVLGALPWYYLGKLWGLKRIEKFIDNYGKWLTISRKDIQKSEKWFKRKGKATACFSRIVPGVRTYISVPAGITRMPLFPFLLYSTLGTALWVSLLTYAGYVLGNNYDRVKDFFAPISTIVIVILVLGAIILVIKRKKSLKKF